MREPSYLLSLWFRWKSMRLPWRRKWLVGHDLQGHTYWEFRDPLNSRRPRRIVHGPRALHPADFTLDPAWMQWLRHTRPEAPSLDEQRLEVQRQMNMKQLAARADERWNQQGSFLNSPGQQQQKQSTQALPEAQQKKDNPWAQADRKGPSEGWQPQTWQPGKAEQR